MTGTPKILGQVDRVREELRFEFASVPEGWWGVLGLFAVIGLCWGVVWMYRRESRKGASPRMRIALAGIRCAVILLLAAIWLEPILATYLHRLIDSYTLLLIDDSSSMNLKDQYRDAERASRIAGLLGSPPEGPVERMSLVHHVLEDGDRRFLRDLSANNRVKAYTFGESPEVAFILRSEITDTRPTVENGTNSAEDVATGFEAIGSATNISRAVYRSVESLGQNPVAGVVMVTDGLSNQGDSLVDVGRYLKERRIPLHVIGVGDDAPPRNIRVIEAAAPASVFKDDPFQLTARLSVAGIENENVVVELFEEGPNAGPGDRPVATKRVQVRGDGEYGPVTFSWKQNVTGRYTYRITVPVGEEESVADDNVRATTVNVIDNKVRVLLIAGSPSWEYRYVSRLLMRDESFDVSCWLQTADEKAVRDGNTIITELPTRAEDLFAYDAVIMLDPDPSEFDRQWSEQVEKLVSEHSGGLLYAAARVYTPEVMRNSALEAVMRIMPVSFDPESELILNRIGHYQTNSYPAEIPETSMTHPILAMGADAAETRLAWRDVPEVFWYFPVRREKPVATVLMRHSGPRMRNNYGQHVLLATQYVGSGRTAFLAFDGTWRWRKHGDDVFDRFWVQLIRYLVEGKLLGGQQRGTLLTEQDAYQIGEAVRITARLYDQKYEPLTLDEVPAQYGTQGEKQAITLRKSTDRTGWYEGQFVPERAGAYEINLRVPGSGVDAVTLTRNIQVSRPNIEIRETRMNRAELIEWANTAGDGFYYDVDQAHQVPAKIPDRHESSTVRSRPIPLWDRPWTLILLVALLSTEWAMRKWKHLL